MRQIIDERDTAKSWYFAITEFSNCLIIRSPSLLFHEYLREAFIFTQERLQKGEKRGLISFTHEQKIIWSQTQFNDIAHDQIIFCWQLFAGQVMSSWQMKRKKNLHRMIVQCHLISFNNYNSSYFKQKGKYRYFNHSPSGDSMSRVFLTLISPITKLRYGWCVNFEWLNKAIIQSGWGEGYQLFLAAHWYFRLILRAKVKCIAAVSFVFSCCAISNQYTWYLQGSRISGHSLSKPWTRVSIPHPLDFSFLEYFYFFKKNCVQLIAYSIVVRPGQAKSPGQTKLKYFALFQIAVVRVYFFKRKLLNSLKWSPESCCPTCYSQTYDYSAHCYWFFSRGTSRLRQVSKERRLYWSEYLSRPA